MKGGICIPKILNESPPATTFSFIINGDTSIIRVEEPESIQNMIQILI